MKIGTLPLLKATLPNKFATVAISLLSTLLLILATEIASSDTDGRPTVP